MLIAFLLLLAVVLSVVPWQQSSPGRGRVVAFAPVDRQQTIDAPVEGRVQRWHVVEGERVRLGQPIVDIADIDPDLLSRLTRERDAVRARIDAAETRVRAVDTRIDALRSSQKSAVVAAGSRSRMGEDRMRAAENALHAAEATHKAARANIERQSALFEQGLTSKRAVELAEAEEVRARTDVDRARNSLSAARAEVQALGADVDKVENDAHASIGDAHAAKATAQAEIAAASVELARIETRLARQATQHVRAPSNGTVLRITARQGGDIVKAGDVLAQFVPDTDDQAVELWIDGNDVNLVHPGAPVRLQFEGWPAVQFSGWPSLAVGTYAGKVAFVDPHDDGKGRFRVVVVPDGNSQWPSRQYLRQGTRTTGWILLGRVKLGYEVWRQLNGFPPEWTGGGDSKPDAKEKESDK
ncbi:MAG: HlyD family efflux transporter periplasmic adaptor subunit [Deltaproteobacteria bacterium]|nr:HlyD family efflux transporter periplasmic adaptor subunit [Deltaproteobacteria bacterium]